MTEKKVSGAPDKYWVLLPALQQHMSAEVYEHRVPVTGGGYTAGSFLCFMGVESKH